MDNYPFLTDNINTMTNKFYFLILAVFSLLMLGCSGNEGQVDTSSKGTIDNPSDGNDPGSSDPDSGGETPVVGEKLSFEGEINRSFKVDDDYMIFQKSKNGLKARFAKVLEGKKLDSNFTERFNDYPVDSILDVEKTPSGNFILVGEFTSFGSFDHAYVTVLNSDGSVDEFSSQFFASKFDGPVSRVKIIGKSRIAFIGDFATYEDKKAPRILVTELGGQLASYVAPKSEAEREPAAVKDEDETLSPELQDILDDISDDVIDAPENLADEKDEVDPKDAGEKVADGTKEDDSETFENLEKLPKLDDIADDVKKKKKRLKKKLARLKAKYKARRAKINKKFKEYRTDLRADLKSKLLALKEKGVEDFKALKKELREKVKSKISKKREKKKKRNEKLKDRFKAAKEKYRDKIRSL